MRKAEPTLDELCERFTQETQKLFYPLLILSIIHRNGPQTRQEIQQKMNELLDQKSDSGNDRSQTQQIGRLHKTFALIQPIEQAEPTDPSNAQYGFTEKGEQLYSRSLEQILRPVFTALYPE